MSNTAVKDNTQGNPIIKALKAAIMPITSIVLAIVVSGFFVVWAKGYGIGGYFTALNELFSIIWASSLGSQKAFLDSLLYVTPMLFCGIAHSLAFKTGLFNIGVSGQFVLGMLAAALVGLIPGLSPIVHIPLIILAGLVAGGLWAAIPGVLKVKRGTNEVVNSIMLNYIALYVANWFILRSVFAEAGKSRTPIIQDSAVVPFINQGVSRASWAIALAIITSIVIYYALQYTRAGYELRAVGSNPYAAEYGGVNISKNVVLSMVLSGAIAGIGGAMQVAGTQTYMSSLGDLPSYGFDGIAVALLARSNPIACIPAAFLFGVLRASDKMLQMNGIPSEIVGIIQATIIIFVAIDFGYRYMSKRKKKKGAVTNG